MSRAELYVDLPLPDEWRPTLEQLRAVPYEEVLKAEITLDTAGLIDMAFDLVNERTRDVWHRRWVLGQTLEEIAAGYGLTRERIRQIEARGAKRALAHPEVQAGLRKVFTQEHAMTVAQSSSATSRFVPALDHGAQWLMVGRLAQLAELTNGEMQTFGHFCVCWHRDKPSDAIRETFDIHSRFLSWEELCELRGLESDDWPYGWLAGEQVVPTASGKLRSHRWNREDWIEAIAWALAGDGFTDWHFSQMAKAMGEVYPERFRGYEGFRVAGLLNSDTRRFQYAGRRGRWRLAAFGDGHIDNFAAIRAVLEASDIPLHLDVIHRRLKREVNIGTVIALLDRESVFVNVGRGVYTLYNRSYTPQTAETEWLLELMGDRPFVLAEEVHWQARREGIDIERLRSVTGYAAQVRYVHGGTAPPTYQKIDEYRRRRFRRWFENRHVRAAPGAEVLLVGFEDAYARDDYRTILEAALTLEHAGEALSGELEDYVLLARSRL